MSSNMNVTKFGYILVFWSVFMFCCVFVFVFIYIYIYVWKPDFVYCWCCYYCVFRNTRIGSLSQMSLCLFLCTSVCSELVDWFVSLCFLFLIACCRCHGLDDDDDDDDDDDLYVWKNTAWKFEISPSLFTCLFLRIVSIHRSMDLSGSEGGCTLHVGSVGGGGAGHASEPYGWVHGWAWHA